MSDNLPPMDGPPQGYPQQLPMQPPPKKKGTGLKIGCGIALGGLVLVIVLIVAAGNAVNTAYSVDAKATQTAAVATITSANATLTAVTSDINYINTPDATAAPQKWTTTHTFTGSGNKKTAFISVPDDWKIKWSCKPSSFFGGQYNVQVYLYGSDNSLQDLPINDLCKADNTSGETEEHQSGKVYLEINSEGSWTIVIQELK